MASHTTSMCPSMSCPADHSHAAGPALGLGAGGGGQLTPCAQARPLRVPAGAGGSFTCRPQEAAPQPRPGQGACHSGHRPAGAAVQPPQQGLRHALLAPTLGAWYQVSTACGFPSPKSSPSCSMLSRPAGRAGHVSDLMQCMGPNASMPCWYDSCHDSCCCPLWEACQLRP